MLGSYEQQGRRRGGAERWRKERQRYTRKRKGGKGKWNGKGKPYYKYNNSYYNSPGKAVGKGLNNVDTIYYNAWGEELYECWNGESCNWWNDDWSNGNAMNLMMMLERGSERNNNNDSLGTTKNTGERDPLLGRKKSEPITLLNKFGALETDSDTDDEEEDEELMHTCAHQTSEMKTTHASKH